MRGILKYDEPLAPYTSWHVGGPAKRYYRPADVDDLIEFLTTLPQDETLYWLGLGSNVLIADEGLPGTVIHTLGMGTAEPKLLKDKDGDSVLIQAESGLPCAKLAKFAAKKGFKDAEFFAGIPGTIGGALSMNAGAFGGETWRFVEKVEVVNRRGERKIRYPNEYNISYRQAERLQQQASQASSEYLETESHSPETTETEEEWFLSGYFRFQQGGDVETTSSQIKQLLRKRSETQPIGVFSCGSVFKNPPHHFAARLIEQSNLKGFRVGDAEVSQKHANFIINHGRAKAQDMLTLIRHIQTTVHELQQVDLQTEVRLLGF